MIIKYIDSKIKDRHLKELLRGSSTAFAFRIIGGLLGYVLILLITRNFGADAMGVYALSLTVISVCSILGRIGFNTAMVRFVGEYNVQGRPDLIREVYAKVLLIIIPSSIIVSIVLYLLAPYLSIYVFKKAHLSFYFKVSSIAILPLVLLLINAESLRGLKKIKEYAFLMNISTHLFATIMLILLLFYYDHKVIPLIAYISALLISSMISFILWLKSSGFEKCLQQSVIKIRSLFEVALPMLLSGSMLLIMGWADTLLIGVYRTEHELGIYNVALRLAAIVTIPLFAINSIAGPKFAEFYGNRDIRGLGAVAKKINKMIFWAAFPVLLILSLFPSSILGIFGEEFKRASIVLIILVVGQFVNTISGSVGHLLQMTGRQKAHQNIMIVATLINILLNVLLIPTYGIYGAAFATCFSLSFWNIAMVYYVDRKYNFLMIYIPKISQLWTKA
jgi:O-antigen/teichoic acid export membrane protein